MIQTKRRRSIDALQTLRQLTLPVGSDHDKIAGARAGGALAHAGERIHPHVEQLQQIVAALRVRHRNDDGLVGQIEPARGIKRVEIGVRGAAHRGGRKRARVRERIHRPAAEHLVRLDIGEVLARHIHQHKRIEIDIGLLRDARGLLGRWSGQRQRRLLRPRRQRPRG
jgi:hypothetical protein